MIDNRDHFPVKLTLSVLFSVDLVVLQLYQDATIPKDTRGDISKQLSCPQTLLGWQLLRGEDRPHGLHEVLSGDIVDRKGT